MTDPYENLTLNLKINQKQIPIFVLINLIKFIRILPYKKIFSRN